MTTRATLADGSTFDIDENTEAKFTHLNGVPVTGWEFVGETPEDWKRDENGVSNSGKAAEPAAGEPAAEAEPAEPAGTK